MKIQPRTPEQGPVAAQDGPVDTRNPPWSGPPPPPSA